MSAHGIEELETLTQFYGNDVTLKVCAIIDGTKVLEEYEMFKLLVLDMREQHRNQNLKLFLNEAVTSASVWPKLRLDSDKLRLLPNISQCFKFVGRGTRVP